MAEIRVPTLGESVTEATIGKWFKKPGDAVAVDEPLVELETDKVTIEVPAPAAGVLADIAAKDGETVAVGALLGQIKEGAGAAPKAPAPAAKPAETSKQAPAAPQRSSEMPVPPSVRRMAAESGIDDIYILRVEQLYPFPTKALVQELSRFKQAEIVWCQEEPRNMGAWFFVDTFIEWVLNQIQAKHRRPRYAGRPAAASTAVGQMSKHNAQLKQFLDEALG